MCSIFMSSLRISPTFKLRFKVCARAWCFLGLWVLGGAGAICAENPTGTEEDQLITVLKSQESLQKKDAACARLKIIGTDKCISALESLLPDKNLSHSARYALEPMASTKAEQALLQALDKTEGPIRIGIISSLGVRHDEKAVSRLARLIKDSDRATTKAACMALGQIGGASALKPMMEALRDREGVKEAVPRELEDGILRCANSLLAAGKESTALSAFKELGRSPWIDTGTKLAVYMGMIRASSKDGLSLETAALRGGDPIERAAALKLAPELKLPGTTEALTAILPVLGPQSQSALIEALQRRNDSSAAATIATIANSPSAEVRLAVIHALRDLGDEKQTGLLAKMAASAQGDEQSAARQALVDLRRGPVTPELIRLLQSQVPAIAAEAARAIGQRGDPGALPGLLDLARTVPEEKRQPVLSALGSLAGEAEIPALLGLVADAKNQSARTQAAEAVNATYQRCEMKTGHAPAAALIAKLNSAAPETRAALMPICSTLHSPEIRTALRKAVQDSNQSVREAAIRAMCDTSDPGLLQDLVQLAASVPDDNFKTMAISACVRLTSPEENPHLTNAERLQPLETILATPLNTAQKRQVLGGLGAIGDLKSFRLVEPMIKEPEVQAEASQAAVSIAAKLTGPNARETETALKEIVLGHNSTEGTRKAAGQVLNQIQTSADYITAWQIAGPYMEGGKNFAALFEIVFPPEEAAEQTAETSTKVKWRSLETTGNGQKPWVVDLLKVLGGEQRVAYARTRIQSETDQRVRLELGSDDGLKVWLNERMVHANNVARPLQAGSDKVDVDLKKGINTLVLKITQNNLGWEFCARIIAPTGEHLGGWTVAHAARP